MSLFLRVIGNSTATTVWNTWKVIKGNKVNEVAGKIMFHETPQKQNTYYKDGVIYSYSVTTKRKLYKAGDGISLLATTYKDPKVIYEYTYTFK